MNQYTIGFGFDAATAAAQLGREGVEGFATDGIGFTRQWGIEASCRVESTSDLGTLEMIDKVAAVLERTGEEAAYLEETSEGFGPCLVWASGRVTDLSGGLA